MESTLKEVYSVAEHIDREKLKTAFDDKAYYINHGQNNIERGMTLCGINQIIDEQQPANVVERSEYIELLKENERLRGDLEFKSEALNSIGQIHKEYVSKIDKAIEDIEDLKPNNPNFKGYYEQRVALNKALEILQNIGE